MFSFNLRGKSDLYDPLEGSSLKWLQGNGNLRTTIGLVLIFLIPFFFNYAVAWIMYHWQHWKVEEKQIPPEYPSFIPYLGSIIPLLLNGQNFLQHATSYAGKLTSARISVLGHEVYVFQDRQSVLAMWKQSLLSSPMAAYVYTLKHLCGMNQKALSTYKADDSGPFRKPYPGSNVQPQNRVDYITHQGLLKGLTGSGLAPTTQRFTHAIMKRTEESLIGKDWTEMPDLLEFFQEVVGTSIMQALVGPTILKVNPTFVNDFWKYDKSVPWFARGVPSFIIPGAFQIRKSLINQLKNWYAYARQHFDELSISNDGDGDPYWGSELMRSRQMMLLQVDNQDDDSLASADLGLIWASVSNIVPSAMMATVHIFKEQVVLDRVRKSIDQERDQSKESTFDLKQLLKNPLLSSIYAEILRLYVKSYFVASSPHSDVALGNWWLPKGKIGLVNSSISHMDEDFWNTKGGLYPVNSFWADRFVTDPRDPLSGPVKPEVARPVRGNLKTSNSEPSYSLNGLEGSWIPYGGGHAICPGRFLAKSAIMLTSALMSDKFDIKILASSLEMSSATFGLGTLRPKRAIPFRIRRR